MDSPNFVRLHSPDPVQRKAAIIAAGNAKDEAAVETLTQMSHSDPVPELREIAAKAVHHITQQTVSEHFNPAPAPDHAPLYSPGASSHVNTPTDAWTCHVCGTTGNHGDTCRNCGSARSAQPQNQSPSANALLASVFLLDPANHDFAYGKTHKMPATQVRLDYVFWYIVALLIPIVMSVAAAQEWHQYQALSQSGIVTTATISNKNIADTRDYHGNQKTVYWITYAYPVKGQTYTGKYSATYDEYQSSQIGAPLQITYASNDPSISQLGSQTSNIVAILLTGLAVLFGAIVLYPILSLVNQVLRDATLQSKGRVVLGEITNSRGYTTKTYIGRRKDDPFGVTPRRERYKENYNLKVDYAFVNPKGKTLRGTSKAIRNDLRIEDLPKPGTAAAILYADDGTHKML